MSRPNQGGGGRAALADILTELARSGRSAVLTAPWPLGAEVAVHDGRVLDARSLLAPSAPALLRVLGLDGPPARADAARVERVRTEAVIDTLRELTAAAPDADPSWRRRRLRAPAATVGLPIDAVLPEVDRRTRVLTSLRDVADPDAPVVRRGRPAPGLLRVRAEQWPVLSAAAAPATPRSLASAIGDSVFRTTCRVAELVQAGLLVHADRPQAAVPRRSWLLDAAAGPS